MDRQEIEALHQQASDHYVRGEYREALEVWKRVLALDPEDEKAREGARLSGLLGESEVEEPFAPEPEVPLEVPPDEGLRLRLAEIDNRIQSGDFHGALRCAESLESERPEDAEVLSALSRACLAAGDSDRAAEATSRLLSLTPEYAEAARLLEECRRVSPAESQLGIVELREQDVFPGSAEEPFPEFESHSFLEATPAALEPVPAARVHAPEEKALDPVAVGGRSKSGSPASRSADPAANALGQRVADLLQQAQKAAAEGRNDDALGLLSRLLILDEENEEGLALEQELRQDPGQSASRLEDLVASGKRHFETGELEHARESFLEALENDPTHKDALEYLEKTDARLAAAPPPPAPKLEHPAAPSKARGSVWRQPDPEDAASEAGIDEGSGAIAPGTRAEAPSEQVARARRRLPTPSPRLLAASGLGLLLLAGAVLGVRQLRSRSTAPRPASATQTKPEPVASGSRRAGPAGGAEAGAPAASEEERAESIGRSMARAATALEAGDYEAAILAYNAVLAQDPKNEEARKRLLEAGELYHKSKVEFEKLEQARRVFASGEYESALRLLYRLPEGLLTPAELNRYKVNGWYDMGVVALRGADCSEAVTRFSEALAIDSSDAGVRRGKQLADACRSQRKDRAYYDVVENLPFRRLDD